MFFWGFFIDSSKSISLFYEPKTDELDLEAQINFPPMKTSQTGQKKEEGPDPHYYS